MNDARNRACAASVLLLLSACGQPPPVQAPPPPQVKVVHPVQRDVVEWDDYTARLQAIDEVEVRPRVSGYLQAVKFVDGATVKKGDLLFVIDPRPYVAILRRAEAELALARARLDLADKRFDRATKLVARNAISQEEADTRAAEARQAEASVQAAVAALEAARLDVEFTEVRAPVGGRAGRKQVTEGNLVNGGSGTQGTLLTTIVSLDPLYVYFEADERAYLKYVRLAREGKRPSSRVSHNPVQVGFADEQGFPHEGYMDFVDNQLDPNTGTILGRAVIANPDLLLSPGLFARLRLVGSGQYQALLLPDPALLSDQSQKFVYVVDEQNKAQYRTVTIGPLIDGLRVIYSGVTPADRVIVSGVQRARPGALVVPEEVAVEVASSSQANGAAAPTAAAPPTAVPPTPTAGRS